MGEAELFSAMAQFGAAGLIGWMWLSERRAAAAREKQLTELHERLMQERTQFSALIDVINANTRALTAVEGGQRALREVLRTPPGHAGTREPDAARAARPGDAA